MTSGEDSFDFRTFFESVEPPSAALAADAKRRLDDLLVPPNAGRLCDTAC